MEKGYDALAYGERISNLKIVQPHKQEIRSRRAIMNFISNLNPLLINVSSFRIEILKSHFLVYKQFQTKVFHVIFCKTWSSYWIIQWFQVVPDNWYSANEPGMHNCWIRACKWEIEKHNQEQRELKWVGTQIGTHVALFELHSVPRSLVLEIFKF